MTTSHSDVRAVLEERGRVYGEFREVAHTAARIREALSRGRDMNAEHAEALHMIANKLARIVCGDPDHVDSWLDIAGYATLAADSIPCKNAPDTTQPK